MDSVLLGFSLGAASSLIAGIIVLVGGAIIQQPDLKLAGDPVREDVSYLVLKQGPTEFRVREDGVPHPPGSYKRDLSYYSVDIENRQHSRWPVSMITRNTAWASAARLNFQEFVPGTSLVGGRSFGYYGRWAGAPEPRGPNEVDAGRYIEILPRRRTRLTIAQKYEGEDAYGFTNESYLFNASGLGLWRNPGYLLPLHTNWVISLSLETTRRFQAVLLHAVVFGPGRQDLTLHEWGRCSDCRDTNGVTSSPPVLTDSVEVIARDR